MNVHKKIETKLMKQLIISFEVALISLNLKQHEKFKNNERSCGLQDEIMININDMPRLDWPSNQNQSIYS